MANPLPGEQFEARVFISSIVCKCGHLMLQLDDGRYLCANEQCHWRATTFSLTIEMVPDKAVQA